MENTDLSGVKILSVKPHYENIIVTFEDPDNKGEFLTTFISSEQLLSLIHI